MAVKNYLKSAARAVKKFFVETFRYHGGEEYCEFLTRGIRKDDAKNTQYPWLYIRAFGALFLLFAVYIFALRMVGNEFYMPTVIMFGGIIFCVPFIIFLYELYPERDFSLISLICVLVLGGTLACVLAQIFFYITPDTSGWYDSFQTGVIEELCKTFVAVLIIVILRVKNPLLGFLIGAAVGAGYSIVEDMGYIYYYANGSFSSDISSIVYVCMGRGLTAFCTHILWTGLVGFVYVKHDRRMNQFSFYFMIAYVIVLHALWDNPLSGVWYALLIAVCVFCAAVPSILAFVHGSRDARGYDEQTEMELTSQIKNVKTGGFFRHGANMSFAIYLVLLSVCALVYCVLPVETSYDGVTFSSTAEFLSFVQNGHDLTADWTREYDATSYNNEERYVEGVLTQVVQADDDGEYVYYYYYLVSGSRYTLTDIMAEVTDGGATRRYSCVEIYYNGEFYLSYFAVNTAVTGYAVNSDGSITAFLYDEEVTTYYPDEYSEVGYAALVLTVAEVAVFAAFSIKAYLVDKNNKLSEKLD